jgi:hypothetical protein
VTGAARSLFARPLRGLAVTALVGSVLIGGACWYFGLDVPRSAFVAAAAAALGLTWVAVQSGDRPEWPRPVITRTPGARRDVEALGWSMRSRGGVQNVTLARAREAARHRLLFLYGLDLYDPADRPEIEKLLAPAIVRTLLAERHSNLDLISFTRLLHAVERLGASTERPS